MRTLELTHEEIELLIYAMRAAKMQLNNLYKETPYKEVQQAIDSKAMQIEQFINEIENGEKDV